MNYLKLKNELLKSKYSSATITQKRAALLLPRSRARESIPGSELFGYTNEAEYVLLSDAKKQQWIGLGGHGSVSRTAVPIIKSIFPDTTTTWANIVKTENYTIASDLGFTSLSDSDINFAEKGEY